MPRGTFQYPSTYGEPLPTHASTGNPSTLARSFGLVSWTGSAVGSLLLSSGSWCMRNFVCALQDWSLCFLQSSGSPIIKSRWSSKPDSRSLCQIPRLGSLIWGLEPSQKCENFSGIIILHYGSSTGWVWDLTST